MGISSLSIRYCTSVLATLFCLICMIPDLLTFIFTPQSLHHSTSTSKLFLIPDSSGASKTVSSAKIYYNIYYIKYIIIYIGNKNLHDVEIWEMLESVAWRDKPKLNILRDIAHLKFESSCALVNFRRRGRG